jgi:transposase
MYPISFRQTAMMVYHYLGSLRQTSKALNVGIATLHRWDKCITCKRKTRKCTVVKEAIVGVIRNLLQTTTLCSCMEIVAHVDKILGIRISRQLAHLIVKQLGYSYKRTRKRGVSKATQADIQFFSRQLLAAAESNKLISFDESGFDQRAMPVYGYALKGHPAIVTYPKCSDRQRISLLLAITSSGERSIFYSSEKTTSHTVESFIKNLPFEAGYTILLDNAPVHKGERVREAARQKGYELLFTPPYCPEFNPIELIFGIIKTLFYQHRYSDAFQNDLLASVKLCTTTRAQPTAIRNSFRHVVDLVKYV